MPEPSLFRHYQIVQDADGNNVELLRDGDQVAVLAFDTQRLAFVHCHVLLEPLGNHRQAFNDAAKKLQASGHPLLARLTEFGEDEGNPFYITTNVDGETLHAYLSRQQDIPAWLAASIACRTLEAVIAACEKGDLLGDHARESLRIVQTGPQTIQVMVADYRLLPAPPQSKPQRPAFEKQAKLLKSFLQEQDDPLLPDHPLRAADFAELLEGCLASSGTGVVAAMRDLRATLAKLIPDYLTGEIATANKPRALIAPQLASYQEVARNVVNLVRIQSQRLDMANPYSMRGTLTKTGRTVLVEQVPPERLCGGRLQKVYEKAFQAGQRRDHPSLIALTLLHEAEGVTCMAEEIAEGVSLADLLRERRFLSAKETYLVLAGLDAALNELSAAALEVNRLRLEDIFVLTGFPRDDPRTAKLLLTKLTEWPAFSLIVRGHPTLASLSGRGLDPAVLLPAPNGKQSTAWHGGWMAAVARFLLALDPIPGVHASPQGGARERDTISRLSEEEMQKSGERNAAERGDFLARYARMIHHHDLVKPVGPPSGPLAPASKGDRPATIPVTRGHKDERPVVGALTAGTPVAPDKPTVGFAEVLFRGTSESAASALHPNWAKTAEDAPPTIHAEEALLPPRDYVPFWLRAAVFIGGSMILGALFAHISGEASWQKTRHQSAPVAPPSALPPPTDATAAEPPVERAIPVDRPTAPIEAPPRSGIQSGPQRRTANPKAAPSPESRPVLRGAPPDSSAPLPLEPAPPSTLEMRPPAPLKDLLIEPSGR